MKVLTANRLSDGAVVYLAADGTWITALQDGVRLDDAAGEAALQTAKAQPRVFVEPYLIDVDDAGAVGRERLRETIRASGPTVGNSLAGAH